MNPISLFKTAAGEAKSLAAYEEILAHWSVPYEERDLPTRFGMTHLIISGPAETTPVVLLHGQDSCAASWVYNIAELSRDFRTYALDTIGDTGKSRPIQLPNSRAEYACWLLDVFEGLNLDQADLIGMSYGGFLATNFALAHPERVKRIVLLTPGIPNFGPPTWKWINYGMPMILLPSRFTISRFIQGASLKGYSRQDPVHEQMIVGMTNLRSISFLRPVFTDEELSQLTAPTLLLIGDHEIMVEPQKALDRAARLIPHLQAGRIPNASHMLNGDQPEIVSKCILQFLRN